MWGKYSVISLPTEKTQISSSQPVIKTASKQYFVLINYPDKHQNFNEVIPLPVRHKENRKHKYNLHVIKMYNVFMLLQWSKQRNEWMNECVFIYRTYHIVSQGGLQFYLSEIGRQLVKAPLAAAISPYLISLTHPTHAWNVQWNNETTDRLQHRELRPLLFSTSV